MIPNVFATRSLDVRHQYEAWRERFHPVLEVMPEPQADRGFAAENQVWQLGDLIVSRVSAPSVRVARTKASLSRDPVDHWVVTCCSHGETSITTEKASLYARAGVPFLWSLGETSESERSAVERVQIFMPRDSFREVAPLLDLVRGSALDTPLGHLLGDYMLALERRLPALDPDDLPRLSAAVREMLVACIAPSVERLSHAREQVDFGRLERVRQTVHKHLRSPALTPNSLGRLVGISRSNLYRLLEGAGGVGQYIQRQRLLEAHTILCDQSLTLSISAIAEGLCFADPSSFSRAFRREFGYSPSAVRAAAISGMVPCFVPRTSKASKAEGFGDLLRSV